MVCAWLVLVDRIDVEFVTLPYHMMSTPRGCNTKGPWSLGKRVAYRWLLLDLDRLAGVQKLTIFECTVSVASALACTMVPKNKGCPGSLKLDVLGFHANENMHKCARAKREIQETRTQINTGIMMEHLRDRGMVNGTR